MALVSPSHEEFDLLVEDITARLNESQGECIYEIGTAGKETILFFLFGIVDLVNKTYACSIFKYSGTLITSPPQDQRK